MVSYELHGEKFTLERHLEEPLKKWIQVQTTCAAYKASFAANPREFTEADLVTLTAAANWLVSQALGITTARANELPEEEKAKILQIQDRLNGVEQTGEALMLAGRGAPLSRAQRRRQAKTFRKLGRRGKK